MKDDIYILCTGGREYQDRQTVERVLSAFAKSHKNLKINLVHGAARGADKLCGEVGQELGFNVIPRPADWNKHKKSNGKNPAGLIRNREMLRDYPIELVIAFPGGTGTAHMVSHSISKNVEVFDVSTNKFLLEESKQYEI